jgi:hypothetical protein
LLTAQAGYQAGAETMISGFGDAIGAGIGMAEAIKKKKAVTDDDPTITTGPLKVVGVEGDPTTVTPQESFNFTDLYRDQAIPMEDSLDKAQAKINAVVPGVGFDPYAPPQPRPMVPFTQTEIDLDYHETNPNVPPYRYQGPQAQGGSVTTPGKYTADHSVEYDVKTKSGKTIATVTGDETLVFNPEQRTFLKKVIGKLMKGQTMKPSKADTKAANQTLKAFKK